MRQRCSESWKFNTQSPLQSQRLQPCWQRHAAGCRSREHPRHCAAAFARDWQQPRTRARTLAPARNLCHASCHTTLPLPTEPSEDGIGGGHEERGCRGAALGGVGARAFVAVGVAMLRRRREVAGGARPIKELALHRRHTLGALLRARVIRPDTLIQDPQGENMLWRPCLLP